MQILIYAIFILMTVIGLRYLFSGQDVVKNPFRKELDMPITGIQHLLLFTFLTGIIMLTGISAERLLVWIVLFILAILIDRNKIIVSITSFFYFLFLTWLICAIGYSPTKTFGIRVFFKYLFPFLVLVLATKVSITPLFFHKGIRVILNMALFAALWLLILIRIPFINRLGQDIFWYYPAILDFFPVAIAIALAYFSYSKKVKYLIYAAFFILPNITTVNRTGLLAASITILIFSLVRYKIKALPYVFIVVALFIGTVLYIPEFRKKMFKEQLTTEQIVGQSGTMTSDDIDSSGRFAMWDWSLKNFYEGKELTGSGLGVLQQTFYALNHPFGSIRIVHNDYVQLLCDTGLIGLVLYGLTLLSLVIHSMIVFYKKNNVFAVQLASLIAGVSLVGMMPTLYTDNVVNYSLMTLAYPFGIYGMLLGLTKQDFSQPEKNRE